MLPSTDFELPQIRCPTNHSSLPEELKFVARRIEKRCPWFFKNTGNVFQNYEQCFLKLRAIEFTLISRPFYRSN